MKVLKLLFFVLIVVGTSSCDSDDDSMNEILIDYNKLPQQSRDFIETHFVGVEAVRIEKYLIPDDDGTLYEVKLANGFELDFDALGLWTEVDGNGNPVPDVIMPLSILEYVQTNYTSPIFIESIEKKVYGYKIELSSGLKLRFNDAGEFLGLGD